MIKTYFSTVSTFLLLFFTFSASAALTPEQIAQKAAALVNDAKGLEAKFTIKGNGRTGTGTIKNAGQKFMVSLPDVTTWFNGKNLYTYNRRINETTVTTPDSRELIESNPLLYIKSGGGAYTYQFSPVKRTGKYIIDLFPKNQKNEIKKLTFTLNSSNFYPEKIVVDSKSGSITIEITDLNVGRSFASTEFEYPKSKYPKSEIVDLR